MAKFLNTTGISYHLEELIKGTKDRLILISPYLQFTDRIKEHLSNLNIQKRDIRIVYRENKLHFEENNWLESQIGIRTSLCKTLHAKCYINENEAIITSMNLYEFSQQNNNEMGIYISKADDADLYNATLEEVQRLLTISDEIRVTIKKVNADTPAKNEKKVVETKAAYSKTLVKQTGFCIRTGVSIPFNVEKPLSYDAFKLWSKYSDSNYTEKFCHFSGESSNGDTTVSRPILKKNWKNAKEIFNL
ncbi:MAG: phospholipase D family protein [Bacteroidia bacterium]|nr:phospholipase D family protein [Bacteroidia bacterium]